MSDRHASLDAACMAVSLGAQALGAARCALVASLPKDTDDSLVTELDTAQESIDRLWRHIDGRRQQ